MIQVHRKPWAGGAAGGREAGWPQGETLVFPGSYNTDSLQKRGSEPMFLSLHSEVIPLFYTQMCIRTSQQLPGGSLACVFF